MPGYRDSDEDSELGSDLEDMLATDDSSGIIVCLNLLIAFK